MKLVLCILVAFLAAAVPLEAQRIEVRAESASEPRVIRDLPLTPLRDVTPGEHLGTAIATSGNTFLVGVDHLVAVAADGSVIQKTDLMRMPLDDAVPPRMNESTYVTDIAWNGAAYIVVFPHSFTIRAARVLEDGTPVDVNGRVVKETTHSVRPRIASAGGMSLVTADTAPRVLILDGELDIVATADPATQWEKADVASDGEGFLVAWTLNGNIFARTVSLEGTLGPVINILTSSGWIREVRVEFDGASFLVVWTEGHVIRARQIATTGPIDEPFQITPDGTPSEDFDVTRNGDSVIIAHLTAAGWSSNADVAAARVTGGSVSDRWIISSSPHRQQWPGIAMANDSGFAVWTHAPNLSGGTSLDVYTPVGTPLTAQGRPIGPPATAGERLSSIATAELGPLLAKQGAAIGAMWNEAGLDSRVRFAVFHSDGTTLHEPETLHTNNSGSSPFDIVAVDGSFLLVWEQCNSSSDCSLFVQQRSATGAPEHQPLAFAQLASSGYRTDAKANGDHVLVLWGERAILLDAGSVPVQPVAERTFARDAKPVAFAAVDERDFITGTFRRVSDTSVELVVQRVDGSSLVDEGPAFVVLLEQSEYFAFDLAWDGTHYGLAYEPRSGTNEIRLRRFRRDGVVAGTESLLLIEEGQSVNDIDLEWDGSRWVVVWSESIYCVFPACPQDVALRVARTGESDGTLQFTLPFTLATDPFGFGGFYTGSAVIERDSVTSITSLWRGEHPFHNFRMYLREVSWLPAARNRAARRR